MTTPRITVAHGDGIGPEIMAATLKVLEAAGASLTYDTIEIGHKVYARGQNAGIDDSAWEVLLRNKVFLKAPITTPQGGGVKSLNVTVRKTLGLYSNVRPCQAYSPFVPTRHPAMNLVIIRENEEDLYAGIEHRQTDEVYQCLKIISRPGCEKIVRYAFEYAQQNNRKKVSCFTKDNIMKMTDGLFHRVFDEIGAEYPDIKKDHWIIDIGAAKLADAPELFDVIVTPNLYGDIISDIAAEIAGSVGLAGSANIGERCAMFEAIHGSAPDIAGTDKANPSGLIHAAIQMLVHLGQGNVAAKIHNAWLSTIEDGFHTADIYGTGISKFEVGTQAFAEAVIERLGKKPGYLKAVTYGECPPLELNTKQGPAKKVAKKDFVGTDVFVHEADRSADVLAQKIRSAVEQSLFELQIITNRGVKVWPNGIPETFCTDHWRCRLIIKAGTQGTSESVWQLLKALHDARIDVIKTENLYNFDGERGYSLGQGQ